MDQDEGVIEDRLHALGVGHEVGADVATIKLHPVDVGGFGLKVLRLFDGDHALFFHAIHRLSDDGADLGVTVCGDRTHLADLIRVRDLAAHACQLLNHGAYRGVDAPLDVHRVVPCGDELHALSVDRLGEDRCGGGAVTGFVSGLACDLFDHGGAHVLKGVLELDLFRHRDAVFGDRGCAEALLRDDVAPLGSEGHFDRVRQGVDAAQDGFTSGGIKNNIFRSHGFLLEAMRLVLRHRPLRECHLHAG